MVFIFTLVYLDNDYKKSPEENIVVNVVNANVFIENNTPINEIQLTENDDKRNNLELNNNNIEVKTENRIINYLEKNNVQVKTETTVEYKHTTTN